MDDFKEYFHKYPIVKWFVLSGIGILAISLILGIFLLYFSLTLPGLNSLNRIKSSLVSEVYDNQSKLVHEFYQERRLWIPYEEVSPDLIKAIIAIEDHSFIRHWGINLQAYPSAIILPLIAGKRLRGASTLTQQLTKNVFLTHERSVIRKIKEALLSILIEKTYTKKEILEFYVNEVYLGGGSYGFQAASRKFFDLPLDSLTPSEYALLAGLLSRPESYRPDFYPEKSVRRRNLVLSKMYNLKMINKQQFRDYSIEPLRTKKGKLLVEVGPYFIETVRQKISKKWGTKAIFEDGIRIYSSLNKDIQKFTKNSLVRNLNKINLRAKNKTLKNFKMSHFLKIPEDTILTHWDSLYSSFDSTFMQTPEQILAREKDLDNNLFPDSLQYHKIQGAVIVMDNETGGIRALVGGENFETSKFNRALQALRSPGSSFKSIVYASALDNGAKLSDLLNDQPITIPNYKDESQSWRPKNYSNTFEGNITLREAFYRSKNLPAIKLGLEYGLNTIIQYARRFGLKNKMRAVPSLSIGATEATLLEMVSAYSVFPNQGVLKEPHFIDSIINHDGSILFSNVTKQKIILSKETAFLMTSILQDVPKKGTARRVSWSGIRHPNGGKTGTTNDATDAWYIGFTKQYTIGIWIGTDNHTPMGKGNTGSSNALPIWIEIAKRIHQNVTPIHFYQPKNIKKLKICKTTGALACPSCKDVVYEYFAHNNTPKQKCDEEDLYNEADNLYEDFINPNTKDQSLEDASNRPSF